MKPLLIVKTGAALEPVRERRGDYERWIEAGLGLDRTPVEVVSVFEGDPLPAPNLLAGVVVTGSPLMVTDRAPWSERTATWLPGAVFAEVPVLGICYGHQLLAHEDSCPQQSCPDGAGRGCCPHGLQGARRRGAGPGRGRLPAVQAQHAQIVRPRVLSAQRGPPRAWGREDLRGLVQGVALRWRGWTTFSLVCDMFLQLSWNSRLP